MLLTLEVISPNGDLLGSNRRKTVGPEGAQVGRSKENDWVINDQYISRVHARIRYVNGAFYVEGLGRNPLALNDPQHVIPNNEPQLLRSGDRFFLDEYEIRATVSPGPVIGQSAPAASVVPDDPFAVPNEWAAVPQSFGSDFGIMDASVTGAAGPDAGNLDPLAALGGPVPQPAAPLPPVDIHQGSVLNDNFSAPEPMAPPAGSPLTTAPRGGASAATLPGARPTSPIIPVAEDGKIPDSWDRSGLTQMGLSQAPTPPPPRRPAAAAAVGPDSSIPDTWDKSRSTRMDSPAAPRQPPVRPQPGLAAAAPAAAAGSARGQAAGHTMRRPADLPSDASLTDLLAATPPTQPTSQSAFMDAGTSAPPVPPATAHAGAPPAQGSVSLEELLRAAGVSASQMSPELASELGQALRIVVQGVMEVLQSRAEIKSQLRMSMTRMQATENNPLKFSPNVEAALHTLLVERNRGYLSTTRAFQEALIDIRNHQIAVLQGIRSAFDAMLEHFDPAKLEQELERQSKRGGGGLLNLGGKARFRDFYVEQFENMTRDPDESFKRLFGEYFAQAYEEQMDRLKAAMHGTGGR